MIRRASRLAFAGALLLAGLWMLPAYETLAQRRAFAQQAAELTPAQAVDRAGRTRMLSQRIAKAYLMLALDVQPERGRATLEQSRAAFARILEELRANARDEHTRLALKELDLAWVAFRGLLGVKPSNGAIREIWEASDAVQQAAHKLTLAYERGARAAEIRWINVAGRQRMLSQRLAKFYLLRIALPGLDRAADMELAFARSEFSAAGFQLQQAALLTPELRAALGSLNARWADYQRELFAQRDAAAARRAAPAILELGEAVLDASERVVTGFVAAVDPR